MEISRAASHRKCRTRAFLVSSSAYQTFVFLFCSKVFECDPVAVKVGCRVVVFLVEAVPSAVSAIEKRRKGCDLEFQFPLFRDGLFEQRVANLLEFHPENTFMSNVQENTCATRIGIPKKASGWNWYNPYHEPYG